MKNEDYDDLDALIPTGQETPDDPFGPKAVIPLHFPQTVEEDHEKAVKIFKFPQLFVWLFSWIFGVKKRLN